MAVYNEEDTLGPCIEAVLAVRLPKGLERVKHDVELPRARRVEATLATGSQRDQQER